MPGREVALPEQAAQAAHRRVRDDDRLGDDAAVLAAERQVRDLAHPQALAQKTSMMRIITGTSSTTKSAGMIRNSMGKRTFTGAFCARSSA